MNKVAIVTDSTAAIPQSIAGQQGLPSYLFPLTGMVRLFWTALTSPRSNFTNA